MDETTKERTLIDKSPHSEITQPTSTQNNHSDLQQGDAEKGEDEHPYDTLQRLASLSKKSESLDTNSLHALEEEIMALINGEELPEATIYIPSSPNRDKTNPLMRSMQQIGGDRKDLVLSETTFEEDTPTPDGAPEATPTDEAMEKLLAEIRPRLSQLKEGYMDFLDGLVEDKDFQREISSYITEQISRPVADFLVEHGKITSEQRDKLFNLVKHQQSFIGKLGSTMVGTDKTNDFIRSLENEEAKELLLSSCFYTTMRPVTRERIIRQTLNLAGGYLFEDIEKSLEKVFPNQMWRDEIKEIFDNEIFVPDNENMLDTFPIQKIGGFVRIDYEKHFGTVLDPFWTALTHTQEIRELGGNFLHAMEVHSYSIEGLLSEDKYNLIRRFQANCIAGTISPDVFQNMLMLFGTNRYLDVIEVDKNDETKFFTELLQSQRLADQIKDLRSNDSGLDQLLTHLEKVTSRQEAQQAIRYYFTKRMTEGNLPNNVIVQLATKDVWQQLVGPKTLETFLASLPQQTDERRNAFTHNQYDRTSLFLIKLTKDIPEMELSSDEMAILTRFVQEYSLASLPNLYRYYRTIHQYNTGYISELPEEMVNQGIISYEALSERFTHLDSVYEANEQFRIDTLVNFEEELLKLITGYATHSFGGPPFKKIISDYQQEFLNGKIPPLPDEYKSTIINISGKKQGEDIAPSPVVVEMHKSLENERENLEWSGATDLYETTIDALVIKIKSTTLQMESPAIPEQAKKAIERDREILQKHINALRLQAGKQSNESVIQSLDQLVGEIIDIRSDKQLSSTINEVLEKSIIRMAFAQPQGPLKIQDFFQDGIDESKMFRLFQELPHHLTGNDKQYYWSDDTANKLSASKIARQRISELFSRQTQMLSSAHDLRASSVPSRNVTIEVIPTRSFIGEMSGYLANACYTSEYPLLTHQLNPIPVAFVRNEKGKKEFAGSMLFFEVGTKSGKRALMIRALNFPQEDSINTAAFIENIFDFAQDIAAKSGFDKVLIPGNQGALSNYPGIRNYINPAYISGKPCTKLSSKFNFNGYDITNDCYPVRSVEPTANTN